MIDLLVRGGLPFTLPLTAVALAVLVAAGWTALGLVTGRRRPFAKRAVFQLGLFAFFFGLLSQAVSLYQMMRAVEVAGSVSPALVAGGLSVSLIAPIYGLGICVVALLLWLGLGFWAGKAANSRSEEVTP